MTGPAVHSAFRIPHSALVLGSRLDLVRRPDPFVRRLRVRMQLSRPGQPALRLRQGRLGSVARIRRAISSGVGNSVSKEMTESVTAGV